MANETNPVETPTSDTQDTQKSRLSNILIGVLLVIAAFLAYNYFRSEPIDVVSQDQTEEQTEITKEQAEDREDTEAVLGESQTDDQTLGENEYLVKKGDSLWKIAENELNDGFLWKEIARVNDLPEDAKLEVGTKLTLPQVSAGAVRDEVEEIEEVEIVVADEPESTEVTPEDQPEGEGEEPSDQIYIVERGDTLWAIAEEFYNDGAMWHEIFDYTGNNLSMYQAPNGKIYPMIHAGNVLFIPGASL